MLHDSTDDDEDVAENHEGMGGQQPVSFIHTNLMFKIQIS
jgi:hypothetical protein